MRIEPPPSLAVANVRMLPATAAADPPDEPPGVRSSCQGFLVVPWRIVRVTLTPPNSDAVVCPASTAPPRSRMRCTIVEVEVAMRSANGTEAIVNGQPATVSSSLTPIGTPPNGIDTSATPAAIVARSMST